MLWTARHVLNRSVCPVRSEEKRKRTGGRASTVQHVSYTITRKFHTFLLCPYSGLCTDRRRRWTCGKVCRVQPFLYITVRKRSVILGRSCAVLWTGGCRRWRSGEACASQLFRDPSERIHSISLVCTRCPQGRMRDGGEQGDALSFQQRGGPEPGRCPAGSPGRIGAGNR